MKWCINKRHVDLCRKYTNMHVKTARGNGSRMVEKNTKAAAAVLMCYALSKPLESLLLQLLFSGLIPRCSMPFQCKVGGSFQYRNFLCVKASPRVQTFIA